MAQNERQWPAIPPLRASGQQNSGATKTAQPQASKVVESTRMAHGPHVDGPSLRHSPLGESLFHDPVE